MRGQRPSPNGVAAGEPRLERARLVRRPSSAAVTSGAQLRSPAATGSQVTHDEVIGDLRRGRIVAGAIEVVAELGYAGLTVSEVVDRIKISRRTFYELFADRDACFLAAFDAALARAAEPVLAAYAPPGRWRERVGAALVALLRFCDEQPALAKLLIVDALAAGPAVLERRAQVVAALTRAVNDGRGEPRRGRDPGALAAEGVVGAVLGVLHARLLDDQPDLCPFTELAGPLGSMVVLPYLGAAAAERELQRVPPAAPVSARSRREPPAPSPLRELNMRFTYRTVRVLCTIGEQPYTSNREVADGAGVVDQGQMSKLLTRLQSLGLIENREVGRRAGGSFKGEPNCWTLTAQGAGVVEALRGRSVTAG
jgi:AcrR family transcriptional regulator